MPEQGASETTSTALEGLKRSTEVHEPPARRHVWIPFLAAGLIAVIPGCKSELPQPTEASRALELLKKASETEVVLSVERGFPSAVFLDVPVDPAAEPIDAAYDFLDEYAALYRLDSPREQLHPRSAREDEDAVHVRFQQRSTALQGGLPLFNSGLTVHMAEGRVWMTTGRYVPELVAPSPVLGADEAFSGMKLHEELGNVALHGEARLGLYAVWGEGGGAKVHTVWRMSITALTLAAEEPVFWRVDVDAVTGEVVHVGTLVATCDKDFDIMTGFHGTSSSCWHFASTDDWFDEDSSLSDYSASADHNGDGLESWSNAHTVFNWYRDELGYCSYDDDEAEVEIVTHVGNNWENASANGFCGTMEFGDDYTVLDILAHEFTHLVDYNANDLEYEGQSGALDESFADVFACFVDGNWTIGEGLPGGPIRDLSDPPAYGDPDHRWPAVSGDGVGIRVVNNPTEANDWGEVHTNSGIPNKAAYLITEGGTHNGYVIYGLGEAKARRIYHSVHTMSLEDDADFTDARDALVGTASFLRNWGWHGFTNADVCDVRNAFASVGVSPSKGDVDCDGTADAGDDDDDGDLIPDASDNCPVTNNPTQSDRDGDGIGDACDDDMDGDGVNQEDDNCPWHSNDDQADTDGDGIGDVCDDSDLDGVRDVDDNCPNHANHSQWDTDGDGVGDACDPDADDDGVDNADDNCPWVKNTAQADGDGDEVGDACDNCPDTPNPDQKDCDANGVGQACDESVFEYLGCLDLLKVEVDQWVHPLDEVALPHIVLAEDLRQMPENFAIDVTVVGARYPWMITDHFGNVVGRSEEVVGTAGAISTSRFSPAFDYHYVQEDGTRADFATTYTLVMAPSTSDAFEIEISLEGVQNE